jgi:Fe2+ transport system protein B
MLSMYLLGIVVALGMAWLFKKTLLKGETPMLVMELPPYKRPLVANRPAAHVGPLEIVLRRAGTVILGINILLWFLASYPQTSGALPGGTRHPDAKLPTRLAQSDQRAGQLRDEAARTVLPGRGPARTGDRAAGI